MSNLLLVVFSFRLAKAANSFQVSSTLFVINQPVAFVFLPMMGIVGSKNKLIWG